MLPNQWKIALPPLYDIADYLEGADKHPDKLYEVTNLFIEVLWNKAAPWIKNVRTPAGPWFVNDAAHREVLREHFTEQVVLDGRWNDVPVELARRYRDLCVFQYSQCPRKGHYLTLDPYDGIEPCDHINDATSIKHVLKSGIFQTRFQHQLAICHAHTQSTCINCTRNYRLRDQAPRFWTTKTPECQECLQHQLMYVMPEHDARRMVRSKDGIRYVYRKDKWEVEYIPVPPGTDVLLPTPPAPSPFDAPLLSNWHSFTSTVINTNPPPGHTYQ